MKYIKEYLKWFVIINSGVLLIFALNTVKYEYIQSIFLVEIFAASAATALPTAILLSLEPKKAMPKYVSALLVLLHYICLLAIMIVLGTSFGWIKLDRKGIAVMAISVAGVYIFTAVISLLLGTKEAKKLNEALKTYKD